jgi:spermidine synthase
MPTSYDIPDVLDRREGPHGEVVLRRRHDGRLEIIANGCFLMDTSDGRSERRLVDAALDALPARTRPDVLMGGLGVGFSLAHAAADPRWGRITVVEREHAIVEWHLDGPLSAFSARALADPRTKIVEADLVAYVNETSDTYDALCLDIDNGPDWTVTEGNENLYRETGLASCARVLKPGGVLAVWSAQPSPEFEETLRNAGFQQVRTEEIPVARGVPDVVHLCIRPG